MAYQAVLFDMDGTVLDTLSDLAAAVNAAMRQFDLPAVPMEQVRASLGNGADYLIHGCVPQGTDEELTQRVLTWYVPYYQAHCRILTCPYPGIMELMGRLKARGIKQAVISNKGDGAVQELAEQFFPGLLEAAVGESATVRRKPDPDAVLAAAERMGVPLEGCVYVGDTEVDLATARNAGMACIAVAWGFRSEAQLLDSGATRIVHTAEELEAAIGQAEPTYTSAQ